MNSQFYVQIVKPFWGWWSVRHAITSPAIEFCFWAGEWELELCIGLLGLRFELSLSKYVRRLLFSAFSVGVMVGYDNNHDLYDAADSTDL